MTIKTGGLLEEKSSFETMAVTSVAKTDRFQAELGSLFTISILSL
jgi:hypothetical protein